MLPTCDGSLGTEHCVKQAPAVRLSALTVLRCAVSCGRVFLSLKGKSDKFDILRANHSLVVADAFDIVPTCMFRRRAVDQAENELEDGTDEEVCCRAKEIYLQNAYCGGIVSDGFVLRCAFDTVFVSGNTTIAPTSIPRHTIVTCDVGVKFFSGPNMYGSVLVPSLVEIMATDK